MATNGPMNGVAGKYIDTLDTDDPEYVRQLMRPVEVKEDVRQMEERKRVKLVLESRLFRDELEELVVEQLFQNGGPLTPNSVNAKNLSDLLATRVKNAAINNGLGPCIPVSDVKSSVVVDPMERTFRCKLASLYRIIDLMGWSHGMQGGISGRISQEHERFLMAPYGILPNEVTTSNLLKINTKGEVLDTPVNPLIHNFYNGETTNLTTSNQPGVDKMEFRLHSAIYASRPDVRCIVHLANNAAVAISALNQGLLPINKDAICIGDSSYFLYNGGTLDPEQKDKLRRALGPTNKVLFLRNFGAMVIGASVEETFWITKHLMFAINEQLSLARTTGALASLKLPSEEEKRELFELTNQVDVDESGRRYARGERDFEEYMRHLDNAGYRTGYPYREEEGGSGKGATKGGGDSGVKEPPLVSSFVYDFEAPSSRSASRAGKASKSGPSFSKQVKPDWLDGKREELNDSNSHDVSKNISKWDPETTSTPMKPNLNLEAAQSAAGSKEQSMRQQQMSNDPPVNNSTQASNTNAGNVNNNNTTNNAKTAMASPTKSVEKKSPVEAKSPQIGSPTKSTASSTDKDLSPTHESATSPTKEKKKKKGFFSSFNRKKDK